MACGCFLALEAGLAGAAVMQQAQPLAPLLPRRRGFDLSFRAHGPVLTQACVFTQSAQTGFGLAGVARQPVAKAALTSCSMSMLGDCLAQVINRQLHKQVLSLCSLLGAPPPSPPG